MAHPTNYLPVVDSNHVGGGDGIPKCVIIVIATVWLLLFGWLAMIWHTRRIQIAIELWPCGNTGDNTIAGLCICTQVI